MNYQKMQSITVERYSFDGYILEVEETEGKAGHKFDFWLYREGYCVKMYMFGTPTNQPNMKPPRVYTKEECLELAFCAVPEYIELYREEYEEG